MAFWCFLIAMACTWTYSNGHGILIEPPSRASAWRFGFDTPKEYDDNQLWCGGLTKQWHKNGGKCGVCGDDWALPEPRPHEYGGKFGQALIVRNYAKDAVIQVKVDLTANHIGYFEFRVCPDLKNTTQECLDKYLLELDGSRETKYFPTRETKIFTMYYKLPKGLTCDHCVMQWIYNAGNNWGLCANGTGALGCGPQEQFRACADITIGSSNAVPIPDAKTPRPRPDYVLPNRTTTPMPGVPHDEESQGRSWTGIIIAIVTLIFVIVSMAAIYIYYYRGGYGIKNLLMHSKTAVSAEPPVRPPRTKRTSTTIDIKHDDLEPGFHNVKLNNNY